jgi:hypothetical protein
MVSNIMKNICLMIEMSSEHLYHKKLFQSGCLTNLTQFSLRAISCFTQLYQGSIDLFSGSYPNFRITLYAKKSALWKNIFNSLSMTSKLPG